MGPSLGQGRESQGLSGKGDKRIEMGEGCQGMGPGATAMARLGHRQKWKRV